MPSLSYYSSLSHWPSHSRNNWELLSIQHGKIYNEINICRDASAECTFVSTSNEIQIALFDAALRTAYMTTSRTAWVSLHLGRTIPARALYTLSDTQNRASISHTHTIPIIHLREPWCHRSPPPPYNIHLILVLILILILILEISTIDTLQMCAIMPITRRGLILLLSRICDSATRALAATLTRFSTISQEKSRRGWDCAHTATYTL